MRSRRAVISRIGPWVVGLCLLSTISLGRAQEADTSNAPKIPEHLQKMLSRVPEVSAPRQAVLQGMLGALTENDIRRLFSLLAPDGVNDAAPRSLLHAIAIVAPSDQAPAIRRVFQQVACELIADNATSEYNRRFLIAELQIVGDDGCVACLSALINDTALGDDACRALSEIGTDAAQQALISALPGASGDNRKAVIAALGMMRAPGAVEPLMAFSGDPDPDLREAALAALAEIGVHDLYKPLNGGVASSAGFRSGRFIDLIFRNAARLAEAGDKDRALADLRLAGQRYGTTDPHVRIALLHAMVDLNGPAAVSDVVAALNDGNPDVRRAAIEIGAGQQGDGLGAAYAAAIDRLHSPEAKAALLRMLAVRNDAPDEVMTAALDSPDSVVRIAALQGLAQRPDAVAIEGILGRLSAGGHEQDLAVDILTDAKNEELNARLASVAQDENPEAIIGALRVLTAREASEAKSLALRAIEHSDVGVRAAGLEALAEVGAVGDTAALITRLKVCDDDSERKAIEDALVAIVRRTPPGRFRLLPITAAWQEEPAPVRASIVRVLGRIGGTEAMEVMGSAATDSDAMLREAVVDAISQWESVAEAGRLSDFVRNDDLAVHAAAVRAVCRMTVANKAMSDRDQVARLQTLVLLSRRPEEKNFVIGALGGIQSDYSTACLLEYAKQGETRDAAIAGLLTRCEWLAPRDWQRAAAAMSAAWQAGIPESMQARARAIDKAVDGMTGFVVDWAVSGPYFQKGLTGGRLHDTEFAPEETEPAQAPEWVVMANGPEHPQLLDLTALAREEARVAYAQCFVFSDYPRRAQVQVGSDDGVKLWVNDVLVLDHNVGRIAAPKQDVVEAPLVRGWNRFLFKVSNRGGGWGLCARVCADTGEPVSDLQFVPEIPKAK
ncbi:MAG: HEAT repeat domain-containing protein [Phycisphaerales bacterium]|nr:HEAT repeat domain-containing protein [Phycisphaerales bacterium]